MALCRTVKASLPEWTRCEPTSIYVAWSAAAYEWKEIARVLKEKKNSEKRECLYVLDVRIMIGYLLLIMGIYSLS